MVISTPPSEIDRTEVASIEGMLTDGVGRPIPNRDLLLSVDGQELTSISVSSNGSFSGLVPIPSDMPLGPLMIEIEFLGEDFILPSNSSVVFTVFAPVSVTVETPGPVAVGGEMTFTGTVKDNLENGWLDSHTIEVFVDGILVGITSSQQDGNWSLQWMVPESLEIGNLSLIHNS